MNTELQENACLYVLGLLPEDEAREFVQKMEADAALANLVQRLQDASVALAESAPKHSPPAALRARIFQIEAPQKAQPTSPPAQPAGTIPGYFPISKRPSWFPWAAAAILAALAGWQWFVAEDSRSRLKESIARQEQASAQNLDLLAKADLQKSKLAEAAEDLKQWEARSMAAEARSAKLEGEQVEMLKQIALLEAAGRMDQARIAVMGSLLKTSPKAVAVSVWDQEQQNGILVVENMPELPAGKDYQLWIIDPEVGGPVSAGVFKVDAQGKVRIKFNPAKAILKADKFAVTVEKEGGVESPTLSTMVVIGG